MTTLTEIVATVVVHSSAAALSHFGVMVEPTAVVHPTPASAHAAERVIARTPRTPVKLVSCPKPSATTTALQA
jgi:hypothetical protein